MSQRHIVNIARDFFLSVCYAFLILAQRVEYAWNTRGPRVDHAWTTRGPREDHANKTVRYKQRF
jgi:hypothetical protein